MGYVECARCIVMECVFKNVPQNCEEKLYSACFEEMLTVTRSLDSMRCRPIEDKKNLGIIVGVTKLESDFYMSTAFLQSRLKSFARYLIYTLRVNESCILEYDDNYPFGLEIIEQEDSYLIKWHINLLWNGQYLIDKLEEEINGHFITTSTLE